MTHAPLIETRDAPPRTVFALERDGVHPLLARLFAARGADLILLGTDAGVRTIRTVR